MAVTKKRIAALSLGALLTLFVVVAGLQLLGIEWYRFFETRRESARRDVFEQTRSWNAGKAQELSKLKLEYELAKDPADRAALVSAIRQRFANYDPNELRSPEMASFLRSIQEGRR